jgi:hypothetical protein
MEDAFAAAATATSSPTSSPRLCGRWKLRWTTSAGTLGSIATWRTLAGAVTDVTQIVERAAPAREEEEGGGSVAPIGIRNVVTVTIPGGGGGTTAAAAAATAVRITQTFEAAVMSRSRLRTKLIDSVVDVVRGGEVGEVGGGGGVGGGVLGGAIQLAAAAAAALGVGGGGGSSAAAASVVASATQPGAGFQPPKTQIVTYVDDTWRFVRDDASVSVYAREEEGGRE